MSLDGRDVILIRLDGSRERYFAGDASRPAEHADMVLSDEPERYKRMAGQRFILFFEQAKNRGKY